MATQFGNMDDAAVATETGDEENLYLTFRLGDEIYGLEILKVQEIIGIMPITKVPNVPSFVRGIINLRGKVIPVMELRLKFGMEGREDTDRTCVIVVRVVEAGNEITLGILVDDVSEVMKIDRSQIEHPPSFGSIVDTDFLLGMAKTEDRVVMLLNIERTMSTQELASVNSAAEEL